MLIRWVGKKSRQVPLLLSSDLSSVAGDPALPKSSGTPTHRTKVDKALGVSLAVLASLQPLEKHRVRAVELRSLYNKSDTRTRRSNQVGRDDTAS